jgi:hypothetical protein
MKKVMLFGALFALFASSNLYAATCSDTGTDGYNDQCDAGMQLDIPRFAVIAFPTTGTPDLSVAWDGSATTGQATDSINICIGTNGSTDIDVTASSANLADPFNVTDGTTPVPYTLDLNTGLILSTGATVVLPNADTEDLLCAVLNIPLELGFDNSILAATLTNGTPFTDTVTITVAPQ